jgi:hypothetical protein
MNIDIFDSLPDDHFGVFIENEKDVRKLLWLLNEIGEKKLRKSSITYKKKYPDSDVFISTVLRWHKLKVPFKVYSPAVVPIYAVYVLMLEDHSSLKIGFTGRWPLRSYDFLKTADYRKFIPLDKVRDFFDTNRSFSINFESERIARDFEAAAKLKFEAFRVPSPRDRGLISYGCSGKTEWFDVSIYDELAAYLCGLQKIGPGDTVATSQKLESALLHELSSFENSALPAH